MFGLVGILSVVGWFVDCVVVVALVGVLHTNISRSLTNNQTHYYYTKSNKPTSSCLLFHFFQFFYPTTTLNNYVELLVGGELNRVCGVCWSVGKWSVVFFWCFVGFLIFASRKTKIYLPYKAEIGHKSMCTRCCFVSRDRALYHPFQKVGHRRELALKTHV